MSSVTLDFSNEKLDYSMKLELHLYIFWEVIN
jgi:hypothetical protein